jgi:Toxic anion resistance protein (TelA)
MLVATKLETADITLTAPDPVPVVAAEKASGLVPLKAEQVSALEAKAEAFVEELAALDPNSPEFGKKVDQLTNMGRKEIADAAGQSNRFLDRPVRAMDQESGVGADLAQLRRTIEDLDPGKKGDLFTRKKLFGIIPNPYFIDLGQPGIR